MRGAAAAVQVDIREASGELYAAVVDSRLAVKLGPGDWTPESEGAAWTLELSGPNYAVWSRG